MGRRKKLIMELNKIYHTDFMNNTLPDKSVQLIIADPPYFEVKGEFDFIWSSFDDYLSDVEKWAQECKRLLADNGTLYWWGMDRKIAYQQIVLDSHFQLLSTLVWEKPSIANEWDTRRTFPERGQERILMYSNESDGEECESAERNYWYKLGLKHTEIMQPIINYLKNEMNNAGLTVKKIDELTGTKMASHWFTHPSQWSLPTEQRYNKLREIFNLHGKSKYLRKEYEDLRKEYEDLRKEYEDLRKEYEDLRKEYENLRRPFNNFMNLTDVLRFSNDKTYGHPTTKPEKLTRALILTSSRKGDTVLAPFAGSGTECAMAAKEGRNFIGFDVNEKYVNMAQDRCEKILSQPSLF